MSFLGVFASTQKCQRNTKATLTGTLGTILIYLGM